MKKDKKKNPEKTKKIVELSPQQKLCEFLESLPIIISKVSRKPMRITTGTGIYTSTEFQDFIRTKFADEVKDIQVYKLLEKAMKTEFFHAILDKYSDEGRPRDVREGIPQAFEELTLNVDITHTGREIKFFLTLPNERPSNVAGPTYLRLSGISEQEAIEMARPVVPEYDPRGEAGVKDVVTSTGDNYLRYNTYNPPRWRDEPKSRRTFEDGPPSLIRKIVNHVLPIPLEREFFYRWIRKSLRGRSETILVLCGIGGSGKNRLKLLLQALHGHANSVDGKRSTLSTQFNSQLLDSTLVWFDEMTYTMAMENTLKELPNDTISVERKGVDTSRKTRLWASYVISNNLPRDNYIAFDARKFVPLVVNHSRLELAVRPELIAKFTEKVENEESAMFDNTMLRSFVDWLDTIPEDDDILFPNMEYRGPMFWHLAHASMSRWQKVAVEEVLQAYTSSSVGGMASRIEIKKGKGVLWSEAERAMSRKKVRSEYLADYSTVRAFFERFRDALGRQVFTTHSVKGSTMGDFYIEKLALAEVEEDIETGKDRLTVLGRWFTKEVLENAERRKREMNGEEGSKEIKTKNKKTFRKAGAKGSDAGKAKAKGKLKFRKVRKPE